MSVKNSILSLLFKATDLLLKANTMYSQSQSTGACIFVRNTVKKPEELKVEVFSVRNTVKKPEEPKVEVFE